MYEYNIIIILFNNNLYAKLDFENLYKYYVTSRIKYLKNFYIKYYKNKFQIKEKKKKNN